MKKRASLFLLLLFPLIMIAQDIGPPGSPPPPPPGVPIDGGLLFLLIAGIAYGVKKVKN
jgi:hypothetical protein